MYVMHNALCEYKHKSNIYSVCVLLVSLPSPKTQDRVVSRQYTLPQFHVDHPARAGPLEMVLSIYPGGAPCDWAADSALYNLGRGGGWLVSGIRWWFLMKFHRILLTVYS